MQANTDNIHVQSKCTQERILHNLRDATRLVSVVKLLCWQHRRVRDADDALAFTTRNSAVQSVFLARAPSCVAIVSTCTSDDLQRSL